MILGPDGQVLSNSSSTQAGGGYRPENVSLFVTVQNRITNEPVLSIQISVPLEQFEKYAKSAEEMQNLVRRNTILAYGLKVKNENFEQLQVEELMSKMQEWDRELQEKYSVGMMPQPFPFDIWFDASNPEAS